MADKYLMDDHKLRWHRDRVKDWLNGERIAPLHIDAGLSKGCNIRCEYCFGVLQGNFFRKGSEVYFPRDPLLRYMKSAGEVGVRSIAFIGEAEPLLNPHVYEAIVAGKISGVDMSLGTNGILFDTGKEGEAALEHLSWIRFNISAASDKAYRRVHRSKEFNTALEKIRFCVHAKKTKGLSLTIGLQMVLTPNNIDQVVSLAKLGKEMGVDYFVVKQCSDTVENALGVYKKLNEYADFEDTLRLAEDVGRDDYNVIIKWKKVMNEGVRNYSQCLGPPFLLHSSGDGKLYPCGMFFDYKEREYCMGDLTTQSFKEIIESDRLWEVIKKVKAIDVSQCYSNCRVHTINEYVWWITHLSEPELKQEMELDPGPEPEHVNFV